MLIGINGFKGAGKNTVGEYIAKHHGFELASFAALLKESAANLFGIDPGKWEDWKNDPYVRVIIAQPEGWSEIEPNDAQPSFVIEHEYLVNMSVREFLQRYGTEAHRDVFGGNFWVDAAFNDFEVGQNLVFTDARFENELRAIKNGGGKNIRVIRPGFGGEGHASEQEPNPDLIDCVVMNDSTIGALYQKIDQFMLDVKYPKRTLYA